MNRKLTISLLLGAALSGLTLYLAFRNVPVRALLAYLSTINYWWIGPSVLLILAGFCLRVVRWRMFLRQTGTVGFRQAFHPLMIGFMMNCVFPGRIGEFARPVILKNNNHIPIATGLATVAAERIFDFAVLIGLLVLVSGTITSKPDLAVDCFGIHLSSSRLAAAAWLMIGSSVTLLAFLALIAVSWTRHVIKQVIVVLTRPLCKREGRSGRIAVKLTDFCLSLIDNFAGGLNLVRDPMRLLSCIGLSLLIWGLTILSYIVFSIGCPGISLDLTGWTTVMVVICFFIALPSVPGFWGLWEAAGVFALALFGVGEKDALGFTLVNHAVQMFPVIVVGLVSAWMTSVNILQVSFNGSILRQRPPA